MDKSSVNLNKNSLTPGGSIDPRASKYQTIELTKLNPSKSSNKSSNNSSAVL